MAESSTFYFTSVFGLAYGIQTLGLATHTAMDIPVEPVPEVRELLKRRAGHPK